MRPKPRRSDKELVEQFVQAGGQEAIKTKNMGEIVGILKQMKETFESNMSKATADEAKAEEIFAQLKAAKTEEIQSGMDLISSKEQLLAKTNSKKAEAKEDLQDTTAGLTADQAFLVDLNKRCSVSDAEWQERQKTRSAEISAVSEAIAIIAGDDAHDTFGRTFSFVQVAKADSRKDKARREKARTILMRQAKKDASASLLAVASSVELDAFTKVTEMINKMIADLEEEQKGEKEHKDYCEAELHTNEMAMMENDNLMKDLQAQINDLAAQIDTFTDEIAQLKASITEMYIQMQRGSENRQAENKEFQTTVADQRATQVILLKALDRLNKFYDDALLQTKKAKKPSLLQGHAKQAPPPGLSEYKSNDGAGSVLTMLKEIIQDAKNMEKTAIKDEQDANDGYVAFVQQTYEAVAAAQSSIVDKQEAKAESEKAKIGKVEDLKGAEAEAKTLNNVLAQLHSSCDFVMENFFLRQEARDNEVSSLQETLAALKTDEAS